MKKAIFAFNGEPTCFIHALLNTLDMYDNDIEVKMVIEGSACKLIIELNNPENPMHTLYARVKKLGLVSICKACANKMGTLDEAKTQQLPLDGDMNGHPSMQRFITDGFEIITL